MLAAVPVEQPRTEARLLIGHALGLEREQLLALPPAAIVPTEAARTLLRRRADRREPLAYLVGRRGFWTLDLDVSPATLIPRPDTETVVALALARSGAPERALRVLDLGTGTGAILLAILSERPHATGIGIDRDQAACSLARANAARHGLGDRAAFVCGDWANALGGTSRFDLVVSNPPYVERDAIATLAPEIVRHEPRRALDGGPDGLDAYRALLPAVARLLARDGIAVLELGAGQAARVGALATAHRLRTLATGIDGGEITRALALEHVGATAATGAADPTLGNPALGAAERLR